jgi:hypothetical protein
VSSIAQVSRSAQLEPSGAFSVELFFEEDAVNTGTLGDGYIDLVSDNWSAQITPTNTLKLWLPTSGGNIQVVGSTAISAAKAHHVVATWDGTTASLYLDGSLEATAAGSGSIVFSSAGLDIGASTLNPTRGVLQGKIGQVALYGAALTSSQIQTHLRAADLGGSPCTGRGSTGGSLSTSSGSSTGSSASSGSSGSSTGGALMDNYPRLLSILQSGSIQNTYDSAFQTWASKIQLNILGGNWEGWEQAAGRTKEQVIAGIKSQSSVSSRVYQYVNMNESPFPCGNAHGLSPCSASWFPTYQDKVDAMNWWVYEVGTSGTPANSTWNTAWGLIDMTSAAPVDTATGLGPYGWAAMYANNYFHLGCTGDPVWCPGVSSSPAPSLDGFYLDNVMYEPRANGDWLRNGTTQSDSASAVGTAVRTGELSFFTEMNQLFPATHWANADFADPADANAPFDGALGAQEFQSPSGYSWAIETWGGGLAMQTYYAHQYSTLASPAYLDFAAAFNPDGSDGLTYDSNGNALTSSPAYQGMRHALAACLMGNGYFEVNGEGSTENWFDELAVDPSTGAALSYPNVDSGLGYLGQPVASAAGAWQTAAWQKGVWKREFQNGIALWNPKGNGAQTVSLAGLGPLRQIKGTQAPSVNAGAVVTSGTVTLQDRDGLILLR